VDVSDSRQLPDQAGFARYHFWITFFNHKDVPIGLHSFRLNFMLDHHVLLSIIPEEEYRTERSEFPLARLMTPIDLPSHKWSERRRVQGRIERDKIPSLVQCNRVELVASTTRGNIDYWEIKCGSLSSDSGN
jgi:hypothetical protein